MGEKIPSGGRRRESGFRSRQEKTFPISLFCTICDIVLWQNVQHELEKNILSGDRHREHVFCTPLKCEISIFQDSSTGSHEKTSQGVGIEKAVFTSSEHNNFIFHYRAETRKRYSKTSSAVFYEELRYSRQAESTAPGIAGDRAFEVLYSNTLLAKD